MIAIARLITTITVILPLSAHLLTTSASLSSQLLTQSALIEKDLPTVWQVKNDWKTRPFESIEIIEVDKMINCQKYLENQDRDGTDLFKATWQGAMQGYDDGKRIYKQKPEDLNEGEYRVVDSHGPMEMPYLFEDTLVCGIYGG
jgi:hypothetical protein